MTARLDRVLQALLGLAIVAGLVGAFVQLDRSSLWYDELFTAWVTTADANPVEVWHRIATDLHPPVYYFTTYVWSLLFGTGDAGLRGFSAVCATGAVGVLFFGLKPVVSLPERLVACALATGSREWFYMAQNARSYALCLLLGAVLLVLAVRLLRDRGDRKAPLIGLMITAALGAFSHFFMTFEAVGLCLLLALYVPRRRIALLVFAGALVCANELYLKLVIDRMARFSVTNTWMSNDPGAYADNLLDALKFLGLKEVAILAVLIGLGAGVWRLVRGKLRNPWPVPRAADPFIVVCWTVPLLVFAFSVASSLLIRPNFTGQNVLVCAPFVWAGCGRLYDGWIAGAGPRAAVAIKLGVTLFLLALAPVVLGRFVERNEPWKESAVGIRGFAACQGQTIPVVSEDGPYLRDPQFPDLYQGFLYGRYLEGFAPTQIFEHTDIAAGRLPPAMRALLVDRLRGQGCPILAWDAHTGDNGYDDTLTQQIVATVGPPAPGYRIAKLDYPFYDKVLMGKTTGNPGFILYVHQDTSMFSKTRADHNKSPHGP